MTTTSTLSEHALLTRQLEAQRGHVLGILEGLDDEAMRRPVLPSGWSCVGLLNHLALDDERFWFGGVVAGESDVRDEVGAGGWDAWHVGPETSVQSVRARYEEQAAHSDAVLAGVDLDAAPAWWPEELFGGWRMDTVRQVVLHVITETATHAGHLDAARELIDGRTWLVLDD